MSKTFVPVAGDPIPRGEIVGATVTEKSVQLATGVCPLGSPTRMLHRTYTASPAHDVVVRKPVLLKYKRGCATLHLERRLLRGNLLERLKPDPRSDREQESVLLWQPSDCPEPQIRLAAREQPLPSIPMLVVDRFQEANIDLRTAQS